MRLLVLGGTHHVGRAVVETALARGDAVTTLTRGVSGAPAAGAQPRYADRTDPAALRAALGDDSWDAVIDTWSGAPRVAGDSAALLAGRAGHYGYVSSRSVYQWPMPPGADESAPVVDGDPASEDSADYAAAKRGGELAVLESFGDQVVLARAGLILGPYELVGRMPWWLRRIERGGDVLAPGPCDLPLQYIDCRDLAAWMLHAAERGITGAFNTVQPARSRHDGEPADRGGGRDRFRRPPGLGRSGRDRGGRYRGVDRAADLGAAGRGGRRPAQRRCLGRSMPPA